MNIMTFYWIFKFWAKMIFMCFQAVAIDYFCGQFIYL